MFFYIESVKVDPQTSDQQRSTTIAVEGTIFAFGFSKKYDLSLLSNEGHTVKKLRSLNLLFSCAFRIRRKFVRVGMEKINTLYQVQVYVELENFSFTFNDAEDYATSENLQKYSY